MLITTNLEKRTPPTFSTCYASDTKLQVHLAWVSLKVMCAIRSRILHPAVRG
nr:MAG TPA: hypothetical protein [Caudoviricetes sp.]